jgi:hypothetical protein
LFTTPCNLPQTIQKHTLAAVARNDTGLSVDAGAQIRSGSSGYHRPAGDENDDNVEDDTDSEDEGTAAQVSRLPHAVTAQELDKLFPGGAARLGALDDRRGAAIALGIEAAALAMDTEARLRWEGQASALVSMRADTGCRGAQRHAMPTGTERDFMDDSEDVARGFARARYALAVHDSAGAVPSTARHQTCRHPAPRSVNVPIDLLAAAGAAPAVVAATQAAQCDTEAHRAAALISSAKFERYALRLSARGELRIGFLGWDDAHSGETWEFASLLTALDRRIAHVFFYAMSPTTRVTPHGATAGPGGGVRRGPPPGYSADGRLSDFLAANIVRPFYTDSSRSPAEKVAATAWNDQLHILIDLTGRFACPA